MDTANALEIALRSAARARCLCHERNQSHLQMNALFKRSRIYVAAWVAAEKALPVESLKLIEAHDALHGEWRKAGWPSPVPEELLAAARAVKADPLASIAFDLREKANMSAAEEWTAEHPPSLFPLPSEKAQEATHHPQPATCP